MMTVQVEQLGLSPYQVAYDRQMELLKQLHNNDQEDDACLILEHPPRFHPWSQWNIRKCNSYQNLSGGAKY